MHFISPNNGYKILSRIGHKSRVKRFINFFLGCLIVAISYNLFLAPNNLVPSGISGLAIILHELFDFNNSLVILIGNVSLLIVSYFALGKEKTKATILGSILYPILVSLTANISELITIDSSQLLLPTIFGGITFGLGAGMIYKAGYTTGGTDVLTQIVSKYFKKSMGKSMFFSDGLIVLASGFVFGPTKVMYAIIVFYIISYISDRVILGVSDSKAFYIITDEEKAIKRFILEELGHGVTEFNARGGFAKEKQTVLMCVLPTKDYYRLKEGIQDLDPSAFFVVTDAYEVFGGE